MKVRKYKAMAKIEKRLRKLSNVEFRSELWTYLVCSMKIKGGSIEDVMAREAARRLDPLP